MNPQMPLQTQQETSTHALFLLRETEMLAGLSFELHEIASLLCLRQWYQNGGSDRASLVRHLEFLRLLVRRGELEL